MGSLREQGTRVKVGGALVAATAALLTVPSAGFALPSLASATSFATSPGDGLALERFTPASIDPLLAQRVAKRLEALGAPARFTPARFVAAAPDKVAKRPVTLAIRVNEQTARAITVRAAMPAVGKKASPQPVAPTPTVLGATRYDLGAARGYQGFTRSAQALPQGVGTKDTPTLNSNFKLEKGEKAEGKPSRFQPRIALEKEVAPGRAPRTIQGAGDQSFDVGGSYRITGNLDVRAGVRLSQERDRLDPLTDNVQDSQAVYVGTQLRF